MVLKILLTSVCGLFALDAVISKYHPHFVSHQRAYAIISLICIQPAITLAASARFTAAPDLIYEVDSVAAYLGLTIVYLRTFLPSEAPQGVQLVYALALAHLVLSPPADTLFHRFWLINALCQNARFLSAQLPPYPNAYLPKCIGIANFMALTVAVSADVCIGAGMWYHLLAFASIPHLVSNEAEQSGGVVSYPILILQPSAAPPMLVDLMNFGEEREVETLIDLN